MYLSDEIRQSPQKHDNEQQSDPNEVPPPVVDQDTYGLDSIAEGVGGPVGQRVHLAIIGVVG